MVIETVISGHIGIAGSSLGYYYTNNFAERNREFVSTRREENNYNMYLDLWMS